MCEQEPCKGAGLHFRWISISRSTSYVLRQQEEGSLKHTQTEVRQSCSHCIWRHPKALQRPQSKILRFVMDKKSYCSKMQRTLLCAIFDSDRVDRIFRVHHTKVMGHYAAHMLPYTHAEQQGLQVKQISSRWWQSLKSVSAQVCLPRLSGKQGSDPRDRFDFAR